ncbi:MAG TPA: hypothetical protein VEU28_05290 [Actinomycetota bacterium]|nr:hypothetical protein [Actinomycetota bacterium]
MTPESRILASSLGRPALDEPVVYPGPTPDYSYLLLGDHILPLRASDTRLGRWKAVSEPGVCLDDLLSRSNATPTDDRTAVLAFGSNASPPQLARKFAGVPGSAIPVVRGWVYGLRLAFSAHLNRLGYIPAAVRAAPSTEDKVPVWVTFPDDDQLKILDATEPAYNRVVLSYGPGRPVVELESGERLAAAALYRTRWGVLDLEACDELGLLTQLALKQLLEARCSEMVSLFASPQVAGSARTLLAEVPGFAELGLVVEDGLQEWVVGESAVYSRIGSFSPAKD